MCGKLINLVKLDQLYLDIQSIEQSNRFIKFRAAVVYITSRKRNSACTSYADLTTSYDLEIMYSSSGIYADFDDDNLIKDFELELSHKLDDDMYKAVEDTILKNIEEIKQALNKEI